jgi:hypothetical protein
MVKSAEVARKKVLAWFDRELHAAEEEDHWGGSTTVRSVAKWVNYVSTKV